MLINKSVNIVLTICFTFPLLIPQSSHAQSNNCQTTINSVVNELKVKGVRTVIVNKGNANDENIGNPTNRTEALHFILSHYAKNYTDALTNSPAIQRSASSISNIMASLVLLTTYSDRIVSNCNNIAVVSFNADQSDYIHWYAIQSNGKTKVRQCIDHNELQKYPQGTPWNLTYCY